MSEPRIFDEAAELADEIIANLWHLNESSLTEERFNARLKLLVSRCYSKRELLPEVSRQLQAQDVRTALANTKENVQRKYDSLCSEFAAQLSQREDTPRDLTDFDRGEEVTSATVPPYMAAADEQAEAIPVTDELHERLQVLFETHFVDPSAGRRDLFEVQLLEFSRLLILLEDSQDAKTFEEELLKHNEAFRVRGEERPALFDTHTDYTSEREKLLAYVRRHSDPWDSAINTATQNFSGRYLVQCASNDVGVAHSGRLISPRAEAANTLLLNMREARELSQCLLLGERARRRIQQHSGAPPAYFSTVRLGQPEQKTEYQLDIELENLAQCPVGLRLRKSQP